MANPIQGDSTSLQPNTAQEGLEAVGGKIGTFVLKVQSKVSEILYGAYVLQGNKEANGIKKALDRGVINLLSELSAIDFCNIFSYLANSKLGKGFDPKKIPLPEDPVINKVKYYVQNKALQTQSLIDNYFAGGITINELVRSVNLSLSAIINNNIGLTDPQLRKEYPEVDLIRNFLNDKLQELSNLVSNSPNGVIPTSQIQNVINTMNKIRSYCVAIQALNNPASLISNIPFLQDQLRALDKIVKPEKLVPLITRMLKTCNKVNDVCKSILGYVTKARLIIRIALLLIKIFNVIKAFFISLPIPSLYTTAGVNVKFSEIYQETLKQQGEKKLIKVLKQISAILDDIYSIVNGLVIALIDIIRNLNIILLNIKSCGNGNEELINSIQDTIQQLESTRKDLQNFISEVNEGRKRIDNTFGGYTIEIISEELADEGISLKRRYGIARGANNVIAVQSKPTFASLDLIIINEVKVLLISQGLVSPTVTGLSPDATIVAMEAMKYLDDKDIDLQNITSIASEIQQDDEIGLQTFVNDLPGGRALRRRVRRKMIADGIKLGEQLKSSDPNSQYSQNIAKENKEKTNKLRIEELQDQKKDIQKQIAVAAISPMTAAIIPSLLQKIKDIDEKIAAIKRE